MNTKLIDSIEAVLLGLLAGSLFALLVMQDQTMIILNLLFSGLYLIVHGLR